MHIDSDDEKNFERQVKFSETMRMLFWVFYDITLRHYSD